VSEGGKYLYELGATELVGHFARGTLELKEFAQAMMGFTQATEPDVQAFAHFSPEIIGMQLERLQSHRQADAAPLPLLGVPVAIKDNIDTEDYPTELGWDGALGRTPRVDAYLVHRLRAAGALIWAKSRTTEMAYLNPTVTKNPRVAGHTPGGSSSGSAAAVAAGLVPVAIGTQTNGSVIRPASFCGVFGFKPTRGLIFNGGVLKCSESLDQVGIFARNIDDLAAVAEVVIGGHEDSSGRLVFPMRIREVAAQEPPLPPKLMFARTPMWDQVSPEAQAAFEGLLAELGDCMSEVELPASVANAVPMLKTVMEAEMSANLRPLIDAKGGQCSQVMRDLIDRGAKIPAVDYLRACERMPLATQGFEEYFDHFDAIVAPATLGPAPEGYDSTGNPLMCTVWTYAGLPCVSVPLLQTEDGKPLGVQLIGKAHEDGRLLRTARWLMQRCAGA
jgi:Asp-tRNA(Asn)/Glu-tRNA(Gln) amidotransferase A subunit family amidase